MSPKGDDRRCRLTVVGRADLKLGTNGNDCGMVPINIGEANHTKTRDKSQAAAACSLEGFRHRRITLVTKREIITKRPQILPTEGFTSFMGYSTEGIDLSQ